MVRGSIWGINTREGRARLRDHESEMKEGTKLLGIDLKHLKKSNGFSFLAFFMLRSVFLAPWFSNYIS